jgi:hypothetical protein
MYRMQGTIPKHRSPGDGQDANPWHVMKHNFDVTYLPLVCRLNLCIPKMVPTQLCIIKIPAAIR